MEDSLNLLEIQGALDKGKEDPLILFLSISKMEALIECIYSTWKRDLLCWKLKGERGD